MFLNKYKYIYIYMYIHGSDVCVCTAARTSPQFTALQVKQPNLEVLDSGVGFHLLLGVVLPTQFGELPSMPHPAGMFCSNFC